MIPSLSNLLRPLTLLPRQRVPRTRLQLFLLGPLVPMQLHDKVFLADLCDRVLDILCNSSVPRYCTLTAVAFDNRCM